MKNKNDRHTKTKTTEAQASDLWQVHTECGGANHICERRTLCLTLQQRVWLTNPTHTHTCNFAPLEFLQCMICALTWLLSWLVIFKHYCWPNLKLEMKVLILVIFLLFRLGMILLLLHFFMYLALLFSAFFWSDVCIYIQTKRIIDIFI